MSRTPDDGEERARRPAAARRAAGSAGGRAPRAGPRQRQPGRRRRRARPTRASAGSRGGQRAAERDRHGGGEQPPSTGVHTVLSASLTQRDKPRRRGPHPFGGCPRTGVDASAADGALGRRADELGVLAEHARSCSAGAAAPSPRGGAASSASSTSRSRVRAARSSRIRSPSRTNAIGPPSVASGATWPMHRPVVPPENRPSVSSRTSLPRPGALDRAGDGEHLAHARAAARAPRTG